MVLFVCCRQASLTADADAIAVADEEERIAWRNRPEGAVILVIRERRESTIASADDKVLCPKRNSATESNSLRSCPEAESVDLSLVSDLDKAQYEPSCARGSSAPPENSNDVGISILVLFAIIF
mmetsp:Transcript_3463/g.9700  ORF Transcript_3463/g.9700 Transcript_3463/m.9700 type:complete len:124 (-) Transcript_3463:411-782(-)